MSCKVGNALAKGSREVGDVTSISAEPGPAQKGIQDQQWRVSLQYGGSKMWGSESVGRKSEAICVAWLWAADQELRCHDVCDGRPCQGEGGDAVGSTWEDAQSFSLVSV